MSELHLLLTVYSIFHRLTIHQLLLFSEVASQLNIEDMDRITATVHLYDELMTKAGVCLYIFAFSYL